MQQRCTGTHQYTWVENHAECCSLCSIYQVSTNPNACFCRLACPNMQLKFLLISGHMLSPSDVANRPVRSALPIDCHTCSGSSASQHQKPEQQFTGVSCHLQVGLCEFQIPRPWTLQSHSRWPHTYRAAARTFLLCAAHRRADAVHSAGVQLSDLPQAVLLHVLRLASMPAAAWKDPAALLDSYPEQEPASRRIVYTPLPLLGAN